MSVLVTGAAGFLGANLVRHLARRKEHVIALVREPPDTDLLRFLGEGESSVEFAIGDVREREGMRALIARTGVDCILHAAALTPTTEQERASPAAVPDTNILGTVNILEAARQCGVTRVVYVSSDAVYRASPASTQPIKEDAPAHPTNLYAIGKITAEQLCQRYAELYGLSVVSGRLGTMYGPMERTTDARVRMSVIHQLMQSAIAGTPITASGLDHERDFIYALDAAEAFTRLLDCPELASPMYNIASGRSHSLREVLTILQRLEPGWQWREAIDTTNADIAIRGTQARAPLDIARLTGDTGFMPAYTLDGGLSDYHEMIHRG